MTLRHAIAAPVACLCLALGGCMGDDEGDPGSGNPESELSVEEATASLEEGPPELRELRDEANQLLGGEVRDFTAQLDELEGTPVVVNSWASWCGPCRFEFPFFQSQAIEREGEIAFLGIDSQDADEAAETFLQELPLPYPSYRDPDQKIADELLDNTTNLPSTAFFDSSGELVHIYPGGYPDEEALAADIDRYAR